MKMWIDPPSGWRYGFPKVWDKSIPLDQFLANNHYPEQEIAFALNYIRMWPLGEKDEQVAK